MSVQRLTKEMSENERRHDVEVSTLSSNLGTVRLELEAVRKRGREMEATASSQQKKISGMKQRGERECANIV